jgi:predicted dehydrogenase
VTAGLPLGSRLVVISTAILMRQINGLRAGIIGTGFIGPVHIEALRRIGVQVTALSDLPSRASLAAAKFGIPHAFGDYRQLIESGMVDVVHIAAPNRFHHEMALAVLKAGRHCICEKPLAMNSKQTSQLLRQAAKSKAAFAVNYNVRFYPGVLHLRKLVAAGELGEIIHVNGSYLQDWLFKETDYNWRLLSSEGGKLRAVADIGTHWMDTVSFILDARILAVFADLQTWHKTRKRPIGEVETFGRARRNIRYAPYKVQTEDFGNVLLRFSNGTHGNLSVSQVAAGRKNCIRIEIYGSKKSAWWCSENPEVVCLGNRDSANEVAIRGTAALGQGSPYIDYPPGHVEGFPDTFKMLFRCVYGSILDRKAERLFASAEDGHREVLVCEAIRQSSQKGCWVRVG